jgi:hypothetical protein
MNPHLYRVRRLKPSRPPFTWRLGQPFLSAVLNAAAAVAPTVDAQESPLSATEIHVCLGDGRLSSSDLVWSQGAWCSLVDHEDFYDAARRRARTEAARRWLPYTALVLLFVALWVLPTLVQASAR